MTQAVADMGAIDEETREAIATLVIAHGANPTAKLLGVSRGALGAYLSHSAKRGTVCLIQASYEALGRPRPATVAPKTLRVRRAK